MGPPPADVRALVDRLPLVDHHCHPLRHRPPEDVPALRACFSESREARLLQDHAGTSLFYRRAVRDLGAFYGVTGEAALVAVGLARPVAERARALFADARIEALLVDTGFGAEGGFAMEAMAELAPARPIVRLETLAEAWLPEATSPDDLLGRVLAGVRQARASGAAAIKTVLAYRSGLRIGVHSPADVAAAFHAEREAARRPGPARLTAKPLLDTLVWEACREAARLGLPVQVHTGFGDTDLLLPDADPTWLRPLLEDPAGRDTTLVLLHCHPFVAQAAWLASVYGQVMVDLSLAIPMLAHDSASVLRAALAHAPFSKVLLGTDAFTTPELYWVAARGLRAAVAGAVASIAADGYLLEDEVPEVAAALLAGNARRVYGLPASGGGPGAPGLSR